jgi:hypothetical protein
MKVNDYVVVSTMISGHSNLLAAILVKAVDYVSGLEKTKCLAELYS